ncbi:MAG: hypothetical protein U0174_26530 [Polyangiaceae bacterium]
MRLAALLLGGVSLCVGAFTSGCVSASKYDALVATTRARETSDSEKIQKLTADLEAARKLTQERDAKLAELSVNQHNIQASLDETTAMNEQLRGELQRLGKDVDAVLSERGTLRKSLEEAKVRLEELRRAQAAAEAKAALFRNVTGQFRSLTTAGQMAVETRNGRLSLLLNGDLIFEAGRTDIKASGQKFLVEFAGALLAAAPPSTNRRFIVIVHVDDAPKGKRVNAALELGAARGVALVDKLAALGVKPEQLVAATVGPFDPTPSDRNTPQTLGKHAIELTLQPSAEDAVSAPEKPAPPSK